MNFSWLTLVSAIVFFSPEILLGNDAYYQAKSKAEAFYEEKSFALAHETYLALEPAVIPAEEKNWVQFRLADTLWRSQSATHTPDSSARDQALRQLNELIDAYQRPDQHDNLWAEIHESLGDASWTSPPNLQWHAAWPHYFQALEWWAGSKDIERARKRYIQIVLKATQQQDAPIRSNFPAHFHRMIPLEVLENFKQIAQTPEHQVYASYLLASAMSAMNYDYSERILEEFETALSFGKETPWYDDALFGYGVLLLRAGKITQTPEGEILREPDFERALEVFRKILNEYAPAESRYRKLAQQQIEQITQSRLDVHVSNIFLPDSEIEYTLSGRNVQNVELSLYPVSLPKNLNLTSNQNIHEWIQSLDISGSQPVKTWSVQLEDSPYKTFRIQKRAEALPPNAYVLLAAGGKETARALLLVTDATVLAKSASGQMLVYFCDALNGEPIAGANVVVWQGQYSRTNAKKSPPHLLQTSISPPFPPAPPSLPRPPGRTVVWQKYPAQTNADGLLTLNVASDSLNQPHQPHFFFISAEHENRQAFTLIHAPVFYRNSNGTNANWKIFAETDRPLYRPQETVQWKITARLDDGQTYTTPAAQTLEYTIQGPRDFKKDGYAKLNAFGSAWDSLELDKDAPLGKYRISFTTPDGKEIPGATLFRVEEYRLPEFKVSVEPPQKDGKKQPLLFGDKAKVTIQADYYFGNPVANAQVEVLVRQNPFYFHPLSLLEKRAFHRESIPPTWRGGVVQREMLRTDEKGQAVFTLKTPRSSRQDMEYHIEARVIDASRREVTASDSVRVTQKPYVVVVEPKGNLHRPGDSVQVNFRALDANENPQAVKGFVKITRDTWREVWISPDNRKLFGDALRLEQAKHAVFPPPTKPDEQPWRRYSCGYEREDVASFNLETNTDGQAELTFTPKQEGYYHIIWKSTDGSRVEADTALWIANDQTTELGYRSGEVEIILDRSAVQPGQSLPIMLTTQTNNRYVLFTTETDRLMDVQLIRMNGTAKLLQLPVGEEHVPNAFLCANTVSGYRLFQDTEELEVPQNTLHVQLEPDADELKPRQKGRFQLTVTDHTGKPVQAELSLSVADESVFAIQKSYADNPVEFFFGEKRSHAVQTQSTFQQSPYVRLTPIPEDAPSPPYPHPPMARQMMKGAGGFCVDEAAAETSFAQAVPAPAMRMMKANAMPEMMEMDAMDASTGGIDGGSAIVVRNDFRATAFWKPNIRTDMNGQVSVEVDYPDSTTAWKATARAIGSHNQFGEGDCGVRTSQPLIAQLQTPRFFTVGDEAVLSGVVHNNTNHPLIVQPKLEILQAGDSLSIKDFPKSFLEIPAHGKARAEWLVYVQKPGEVKIQLSAKSTGYSDAMEQSLNIYERGIEKFIVHSGKLREDSASIQLTLPAERRSTKVTLHLTPSLAAAMLDALPYLAEFPYDCVEQTMNRFLPAIVIAKTLRDLGLNERDIMAHTFGGIETQFASKTHPEDKTDLTQLESLIQSGIKRLYALQQPDGSWSWWEEGEGDPWMSAYVLWGLNLVQESGFEVRPDVLAAGSAFLKKSLVQFENNFNLQAWILHALAHYRPSLKPLPISKPEKQAVNNLWKNRERLNAYGRALFAICLDQYNLDDRAKILLRNLRDGVQIDAAPNQSVLTTGNNAPNPSVIATAHWGKDGIYHHWSEGGIEATVFALKAFLAIAPDHELVEPVMNYLIKNRRGAHWSNTRDTSIALLALNDYLRQTHELQPNLDCTVTVNGQKILSKQINNVFREPSEFVIDPQMLFSGENDIQIQKQGDGALYFALHAEYFTKERPITPAGNEIFIKRQYFRKAGYPTLLKGYVYENKPLANGDEIESGDRIEVVLTLEAKNDYEYLVFEDIKPAGFETAVQLSGQPVFAKAIRDDAVQRRVKSAFSPDEEDFTGRSQRVHQELRDRKTAFFLDRLPQGVWEIRYELRAETPGKFSALPTLGRAMYIPEIRANSGEFSFDVEN